jgi:hypothetical protein
LLEEQTGNPSRAMEHYRTAFRHAPELADPKINPEVLYSKLYLGALVQHGEEKRFTASLPMPLLEPRKVKRVMARIDKGRPPEAAFKEQAEAVEPAAEEAAAAAPAEVGAEEPAPPVATRPPADVQPKQVQPRGRRLAPGPRPTQTPRPQRSGFHPGEHSTTPGSPSKAQPSPEPTPSQEGVDAPQLPNVSPEASLQPLWPGLPDPMYTLHRMWTTSPSGSG